MATQNETPQFGTDTAYEEGVMTSDREAQVLAHVPLVEHVIRRMQRSLPRDFDERALLGAGVVGLLQAVDKFDPDKGVPFEAYARIRIHGAVQDELRSLDHLTRGQRQRAVQSRTTLEQLTSGGAKAATDEEVARAADLTVEDVRLSNLYAAPPKSYDPHVMDDTVTSTPWQDAVDVEEWFAEKQALEQLRSALKALGERDRRMITLYYGEDLTLREVGKVFDVSLSRVSQLLSRARAQLLAQLNVAHA